jgi:hypothetical protein
VRPAKTPSYQTITNTQWRNKHSDFKGGTMRIKPRMLKYIDGVGTCLIPVVVVNEKTGKQITQEVWTG